MPNALAILQALGGWDNIRELESCITRLRVELVNPEIVDRDALKEAGAYDALLLGTVAQVVIGPEADELLEEIEALPR